VPGTTVTRRLPPDVSAPGIARRAVHELPARVQPEVPTLELMVSELVTNCVMHAALAASDRIGLLIEDCGDCVRVEVTDPGTCFDDARAGWDRARDRAATPGPRLGQGGLVLVRSVADRCGVRWDDGTVAWVEIAVAPGD
jgi:anti-sigma regulatory factor (Ser/Thr protein kinase)